jgi:(p)ppGpp synthase/HD superfamily hydrolase
LILKDLSKAIAHAFRAHSYAPAEAHMAVRKWDSRTPYAVHPVWCAMTFLTETSLPEQLRIDGAKALLFHDLLEDTTADLPSDASKRVRELVAEMTFESSDEEMEKVWGRSRECRLLKLYDKVSNLLDGSWMDLEKRAKCVAYTRRLADDVARNYGLLNIVMITRAICG